MEDRRGGPAMREDARLAGPAGPAIAGSMALAGVALGTLVNPWFLALSAFFGAGLTFAGASGTCGLALLLMKLPWNRPLPVEGPAGATCAAGNAAASTCAAPAGPRG
jgi:hypothetical protein